MELSHSLTLNEEALAQIPPAKRPVFIFEWLRFLDKVLVAAQKVRLLYTSMRNKVDPSNTLFESDPDKGRLRIPDKSKSYNSPKY
jgi:hypothetical protein